MRQRSQQLQSDLITVVIFAVETKGDLKMEWISVKDELPKDDDYYLIWPHGKYAGAGATFWPWGNENGHEKNTFEMESEYGEITQVSVTHWMPLPDGPKAI